MLINKWLASAFALMITGCLPAQTDRAELIETIKKICPTADVIEIEIKPEYTEVDYLCDGILIETGINQRNEIVFTEQEAVIDEKVLRIISNKLQKQYADWQVDEYALVKLSDTSFYKVEIIQDGVEENVYFTVDGKNYKGKVEESASGWSVEDLRSGVSAMPLHYDLLHPDRVIELPSLLKEVSGVAYVNDHTVACIQDEIGVVFLYDIDKDTITGSRRFADVGDFEDVVIMGDTAVILRSDGTVFLVQYNNYAGSVKQRILPVACLNVEGLFYDPESSDLLVACKDQALTGDPQQRLVYRFNKDMQGSPATALTVHIPAVTDKLVAQFPNFAGRRIPVNPSAVAVHPINGDIYVLSAESRLLLIYSGKNLTQAVPLPADLFYKPEGIDFDKNGNMLISSEGAKKGYPAGQLFVFHYRNISQN